MIIHISILLDNYYGLDSGHELFLVEISVFLMPLTHKVMTRESIYIEIFDSFLGIPKSLIWWLDNFWSVIMLHKLIIWKHLSIIHTDLKRRALCFTFPLPQNFLFKSIMSYNLLSPGDVASFPLKICCFSRRNIRYAFVSSILHIWENLICLCVLSFSFLISILAEKMSYY